jgi:hypothetical protein
VDEDRKVRIDIDTAILMRRCATYAWAREHITDEQWFEIRDACNKVGARYIEDYECTELWRPVGIAELNLIEEMNFKRFPPRLPEQPIFYPVANKEYAKQIASRWNKDEGAVVHFKVPTDWLSKYQIQKVGGAIHQEYWIPAEDLDEMNDNIVGEIRIV